MCQSHTGRLTGLWFLPKPAFGLNTNDDDTYKTIIICSSCTVSTAVTADMPSVLPTYKLRTFGSLLHQSLTLILLTWTIWRAPTNASKWRMEFNSAFKGLKSMSIPACVSVSATHHVTLKMVLLHNYLCLSTLS